MHIRMHMCMRIRMHMRMHVRMRIHTQVRMLIASCAHRAPTSLTHEIVPFQKGDKLVELRTLLAERAAHQQRPQQQWPAAVGVGVGVGEDEDEDAAERPRARPLHERTLIFCRGVQSARAVQHYLEDAGEPVAGSHGKIR